MSDFLIDTLQSGGAISRRLGDLYEFRPQQLQMAQAVRSAVNENQHLLVEAGTGVGKSFAYLLPAIQYAVENKKRVVVSTHTISLQEQLIEKDIPLIQAIYPDEFTAVLVKGRGNYLCQRRLKQTGARANMLFDRPEQRQSVLEIQDWAAKTRDGSLADLPIAPEPGVWESVCAERGNCLGKRCEFYNDCFWQTARRRMNTGNVLVVNHALFFSDLALRISGVNYLPKYDVAILDEAHTVEDVAAEHFGLKVSESGLRHQLRHLYDPRRGKGLLSTHGSAANPAISDLVELYERSDDFFDRCAEWQSAHGRQNGRLHEASMVENDLSPVMNRLVLHMKEILPTLESQEEISELSSASDKVAIMEAGLSALLAQAMPDAVYWMESGTRARRNISLHAAPVNVADGLRRHLFDKLPSVVMCSATLCTAVESSRKPARKTPARRVLDEEHNIVIEEDAIESAAVEIPGEDQSAENKPDKHVSRPANPDADPAFAYIQSRLGAESARTLALGSPFDYATQATLYIESDLPEPSDALRFAPAVCEKILEYVRLTEGGAFVLFTSFSSLADAERRLGARLRGYGFTLLVQERTGSRKKLLQQFRDSPHAVLFGTSSFWQGIDVRGDALRNVIIVKLPFSVPDEPVVEARLEAITRAGGNAFMQYSVPEAIIKLKQGFGRLIRSNSDRGIVVILDSRIRTKRYGKLFLSALPPCKLVINGESPHEG